MSDSSKVVGAHTYYPPPAHRPMADVIDLRDHRPTRPELAEVPPEPVAVEPVAVEPAVVEPVDGEPVVGEPRKVEDEPETGFGHDSQTVGRRRRRVFRWIRDFILSMMILAAFLAAMAYYFLQRYEVMSSSMEPTLQVGETYWALRLMQTPERGDIVSFLNPSAPESGEIVIKRIIALPGETVEAYEGIVRVNTGALDEGVWVENPEFTADFDPITLGSNQYFVMGDNRDESFDSRSFGPVRLEDLQYIVKEKGEEWPVGMGGEEWPVGMGEVSQADGAIS